uniref:Uncharacterized protein n=1 Tax=Romanomermis culicivorax TaxID=13658 RepID=A0A915JGE5_ROMCU
MPCCGCRFWCRPKANQLWTVWYCGLVVLINVYLLYVARLKYKAYEDHPALKRKPLNNSLQADYKYEKCSSI